MMPKTTETCKARGRNAFLSNKMQLKNNLTNKHSQDSYYNTEVTAIICQCPIQ